MFEVGQLVVVKPRTGPGELKLGGIGILTRVNSTLKTVSVRYTIESGRENDLDWKFVSSHSFSPEGDDGSRGKSPSSRLKVKRIPVSVVNGPSASSNESTHVFKVGDLVSVSSRTTPGIYKVGGEGFVTKLRLDGRYDIKLVLGGRDLNVDGIHVSSSSLSKAPDERGGDTRRRARESKKLIPFTDLASSSGSSSIKKVRYGKRQKTHANERALRETTSKNVLAVHTSSGKLAPIRNVDVAETNSTSTGALFGARNTSSTKTKKMIPESPETRCPSSRTPLSRSSSPSESTEDSPASVDRRRRFKIVRSVLMKASSCESISYESIYEQSAAHGVSPDDVRACVDSLQRQNRCLVSSGVVYLV